MRTDESWADLESRVRNSKSGPWDQVALKPEDFLQLMDERRALIEAACEDCRAAKCHAYSDATTPGFFQTQCSKHRRNGE